MDAKYRESVLFTFTIMFLFTLLPQNTYKFLPSADSPLTFSKCTVKYKSSRSVDEGALTKVLVQQSENAVSKATNEKDVYANVDVRLKQTIWCLTNIYKSNPTAGAVQV